MLSVGQAKVHVVDKGAGTPTLLLHGNPDSSDIWNGITSILSPNYRCIAPDLPGFGRSTAPANFDCSLDGMATFVDGLVTAMGIDEPVNLVVHDIGGPYGLAWAVRHPHKVRSLVIMNTVFSSNYRWHFYGRLWRMPIVGELVQAMTSRRRFIREMQRGSRKLTIEQINRSYDLITAETRRMILRWYRATDPQNFKGWEDRLRELASRVPSIVLWAGHDPYIPARLAEQFGASTVERFPQCGHWLPAEAPAEVANRMLKFYADSARP